MPPDPEPPEPPASAEEKRSWWQRLLLGYLVVLALSHLVAWLRGPRDAPRAPADVSFLEVASVAGGERGAGRVQLAYRDVAPRAAPDASVEPAPVLLLHGSPGDGASFGSLAHHLSADRRLIVPDFPGFGHSTADVPDYSVEAHAGYVLQLLEALELAEVDVVAFSMAGGVAAHLADLAPARVRSLALVAAIGVQETELFGTYTLNHAVHGLQLALIQGGLWLIPHFGALDGFVLGVPYARNFFDTDQRPLRELLAAFENPVLIVHGDEDFLVMPETAVEHERIMPQSELQMLETSHFLIWTIPGEVAARLTEFFDRVERGLARTRSTAPPERIARAAAEWDPANAPRLEGPALLIAFLLLAAATLVSEDLTCIGAGLLVAQGRLGFITATLACFLGIFVGDMLLYLAGRWLGRPALHKRPLRWFVSPGGIARATHWFDARGARVIFLSRFLPGLRLPTYVAAGILRMRFALFAFYFMIAGLVWTPILVGASRLVGARALVYVESFERWALPALIALALGILFLERLIVPLFSYRGRRLLLGAWRRKRHYEFWHPVVFYVPVVLKVAWLALRHRSLTVLTAANPGIPTGGFIGESKSQILGALRGSEEWIARYVLLRPGDALEARRARAQTFMRDLGLRFPIVLKPDVGQRGSGVRILRDADALERALEAMRCDSILQEFVAGPEYGVFWLREPGAEHGRIFSITEKRLPVVAGDGQSTLEELILADDRAVSAASTYFDANAGQLARVPAAHEEVELVHLGTHCRGAVFLDGAELSTPALAERIEAISRSFEGFWFGRYDVRATSAQALSEGRDFKILELNGLTSEATHIYDPRHRLVDAYGTLFEQWRLAFEIGVANREQGAPVASVSELFGAWRDYQKLQRTHT